MSFMLLQIIQEPITAQQGESYFYLILKAGWILLPIGLLSFVSVYIIGDRWTKLHRANHKHDLIQTIMPMLKEGKIDLAITTCELSTLPVGKVLGAGLKTLGSPISDIQDAMESEARQQVDSLNNGMHYLSITSSVAPMLGFLGTIFGVIKIFYNISLADNISIGIISGGLYQKMMSSAAGLLVGIIAYSAYHILNAKIDRITSSIERQSNQLISFLRSPN